MSLSQAHAALANAQIEYQGAAPPPGAADANNGNPALQAPALPVDPALLPPAVLQVPTFPHDQFAAAINATHHRLGTILVKGRWYKFLYQATSEAKAAEHTAAFHKFNFEPLANDTYALTVSVAYKTDPTAKLYTFLPNRIQQVVGVEEPRDPTSNGAGGTNITGNTPEPPALEPGLGGEVGEPSGTGTDTEMNAGLGDATGDTVENDTSVGDLSGTGAGMDAETNAGLDEPTGDPIKNGENDEVVVGAPIYTARTLEVKNSFRARLGEPLLRIDGTLERPAKRPRSDAAAASALPERSTAAASGGAASAGPKAPSDVPPARLGCRPTTLSAATPKALPDHGNVSASGGAASAVKVETERPGADPAATPTIVPEAEASPKRGTASVGTAALNPGQQERAVDEAAANPAGSVQAQPKRRSRAAPKQHAEPKPKVQPKRRGRQSATKTGSGAPVGPSADPPPESQPAEEPANIPEPPLWHREGRQMYCSKWLDLWGPQNEAVFQYHTAKKQHTQSVDAYRKAVQASDKLQHVAVAQSALLQGQSLFVAARTAVEAAKKRGRTLGVAGLRQNLRAIDQARLAAMRNLRLVTGASNVSDEEAE